jgi:hypothetical protein
MSVDTKSLLDQLENKAVDHFLLALGSSPDEDGTFRHSMNTLLGGKPTPVLLVGGAHRKFMDGRVTAIVNPSHSLSAVISEKCGYGTAHLKELIAGECDLMLQLWIIAGGATPNVTRNAKYIPKKPRMIEAELC